MQWGRETKSEEHQDLQMFQELEQLYSKDKQTYEILQNRTAHPQFTVLNQKIFKTDAGRMQLYLPQGRLRDFIMRELHDAGYAGTPWNQEDNRLGQA